MSRSYCKTNRDAGVASVPEFGLPKTAGMNRITSSVLLLLIGCVHLPARAEWKLIDLTDEAAFYVEEFFEPGPPARIWEVVDYRQPNASGARSSRVLWEIDCARSRVRTLIFSSHALRMGMGEPISVDRIPGEWVVPPEDSPLESVFILACGVEPVAGPKT